MDFLELSLREWRVIAAHSGHAELINFLLKRHGEIDGNEVLVLRPVNRDYDTGKLPTLQDDEEARIEAARVHWEERKAIEANLIVRE